MTLTELNESYDEYVLTEEYYLQEGLRFFKKSKRLKKYANKINKKIAKKEGKRKVSPAQLNTLKTLSKNLTKLSDEYAVIEKDFASGDVNKKMSKEKLKSVDRNNKAILAKLKSKEVGGIFKAVGLGALVVGLGAVLFQIGMTPQMTSVLTKGFQDVSSRALAMKDAAAASLKASASKIADFKDGFGGVDAVSAPGVPASASDISGLSGAESKLKAATKAAKNSGRADVAGLAKATADRSSAAELASKVSAASKTRAVRDAETAAAAVSRGRGAADYTAARTARTTVLRRGDARTSRASRALAAARAARNRSRGL